MKSGYLGIHVNTTLFILSIRELIVKYEAVMCILSKLRIEDGKYPVLLVPRGAQPLFIISIEFKLCQGSTEKDGSMLDQKAVYIMSPHRPKDRSAQNGLRDPTALKPTLYRAQALLIITPQPIIPTKLVWYTKGGSARGLIEWIDCVHHEKGI
jgi:hypothetical protein